MNVKGRSQKHPQGGAEPISGILPENVEIHAVLCVYVQCVLCITIDLIVSSSNYYPYPCHIVLVAHKLG